MKIAGANEMDLLMSLQTSTVTLEESDRQVILLALARLALERPGWDQYICTVAAKLHGERMLQEFQRYYIPGKLRFPIFGDGEPHRVEVEHKPDLYSLAEVEKWLSWANEQTAKEITKSEVPEIDCPR